MVYIPDISFKHGFVTFKVNREYKVNDNGYIEFYANHGSFTGTVYVKFTEVLHNGRITNAGSVVMAEPKIRHVLSNRSNFKY